MFSFHKPKVYRSTTGCCICKAKSSSSRFTDSKKYEEDFIECFQLEERRTGEICNACVLLVKRWKKLPAGSNRNWRHVVDARAGPGIKSLTKFKSKNKKKLKESPEKFDKIVKKKHVYLKPDRDREESPAMSDELTEEDVIGNGSKGSSRSGSPAGSDDIRVGEKRINRESDTKNDLLNFGILFDSSYFKREVYCCGIIFKGLCGEIITESKSLKRCVSCSPRQQQQQQSTILGNSPAHSSASASPIHSSASTSPEHTLESATDSSVLKPTSKTFSDSSSDSGYDESSNQGMGESKLAKFVQAAAAVAAASAKTTVKIQPVKGIHLIKPIPASEAVRLKIDVPMKLVPIKQIDQLICKPVTLVASTNVTLGNSTSHPVASANPLVDFAMHASSRQSLSN